VTPRFRRLLALGATTLALAGVTACGNDAVDLDAAAKDSLVVYSGRNETLISPVLDLFTKETGIKVTPRFGDSAELAATLLEEGDRTPASVFLSQDAGALGALQDASRLQDLDTAVLDLVPERFRSTTGKWVGVTGRSRVLAYNTDAYDEAALPTSVLDLTKPEFTGKVGYVPTNASFQAFVTGLRVALGEAKAKEFLTAFAANEPKEYENNIKLAEAVDTGEVPLGLLNHYYLYERADELGGYDKLKAHNHFFAAGDPGSLINVAGVGVLAGKADERTATFVAFLLGDTAQTYFAEKTHEYPLVAGFEAVGTDLPRLEEIKGPDIDLSELDTLAQTLALLDEVGLT
jgi:iron(III) transport system substrate-binding protein